MSIKIYYGNPFLCIKEAERLFSSEGITTFKQYVFPLTKKEHEKIFLSHAIIRVKDDLSYENMKELHDLIPLLKTTGHQYSFVFDTYNQVSELANDTSIFIVNKTLLLNDGNSIDDSLEIWLDRLLSNQNISIDKEMLELLILSYLTDPQVFFNTLSDIETLSISIRSFQFNTHSWVFPDSLIKTWKLLWGRKDQDKYFLLFSDLKNRKHTVSLYRFFIEQRLKESTAEGVVSKNSPSELIDIMGSLKNTYTLGNRQFLTLISKIDNRIYQCQKN